MDFEVAFVADASLTSVMAATGVRPDGHHFAACPLNVGDVLSFPGSPTIFFKITKRWLEVVSGERQVWNLLIEPAPNPLMEPRSAT